MARFLICSFALVLLYPSGIDMYLVGLPRIAQDLGASEAQLHIAFSVYLAGMAAAMLFAGRAADKSGRKPVAIFGSTTFILASLLCAQAQTSDLFLVGRFIQGIGAGSCYVVAFAVLRDTLDDRRRAGAVAVKWHHLHYPGPGSRSGSPDYAEIPVAEPVLHHDRHGSNGRPALGLYAAGNAANSPFAYSPGRKCHGIPAEPLFLSRIVITTLSVTAILTYVNVSPVLMMEEMGFDRGQYSMAMALMALVSMTVSFSTPFALTLFKPRTLMLTSQVMFFTAGTLLSLATSQTVTMLGLALICAGFSVGFGVAMSQALGPFTLRAGVASSVLGIAQVCGSSLWIWLAAIIGLSAMNMLIGILIGCSIVSIVLILAASSVRAAQHNEEIPVESRS